MSITFDSIPGSIRKPGRYSEYNSSLADQGLPANAKKMLILGQKTTDGTGISNIPVQVYSAADAVTLAGAGSVLTLSVAAALKANPNLELWISPIPDAAGAKSVGTITFAGTASTTGSLEFWIGNVRAEATVFSGDSASEVATSVQAALAAIHHLTPMIATVDTAVVTLTARNFGTLGNNVAVAYKNNNIGTTTTTVVQPASGATDPSIETALDNVFAADYDVVLDTLNDSTNLGLFKTHMFDISSPTEDRPCTGYFGYTGVQATLETLAGTTLNYERMAVAYLKYTKTTESGHSLDYEIGAAFAAVVAREEDPARPFNTLALRGIAPCALEDRLSRTQQESLLNNGVTPLEVGPGESVQIVRAITTYTTDATGTKSIAYLDLTTILSLDYGKKAIETREAQRFPRDKKTERTKAKLKTEIYDVIRLLAQLEIWNLCDIDEILVEDSLVSAGTVHTRIPAYVVAGMHVIANRIDLLLSGGK